MTIFLKALSFFLFMYKIKELPEDFIVKEIAQHDIKPSGKYALCLLKKRDYTTSRAVEHIAQALYVKDKQIGYAGLKDRNAVTYQYITIEGRSKEKIEKITLKDIELTFLGYVEKKIFLGNLEGNSFQLVVRNIDAKPDTITYMPNLFGEQRFSTNNVDVGRAIVKKKFSDAISVMLKIEGDYEREVKLFLARQPTNFIGALRTVPLRIMRLYVHSYQSYLWNKCVSQLIYSEDTKDCVVILPGFGVSYDNSYVGQTMQDSLKKEGITLRDFIIPQFPELSIEGEERKAFVELSDFSIGEPEKDELNPSKKKVAILFSLPKGSYATVALSQLFKDS
jgi:tRNA pseudouridine13 synthase